ncbi:MAG: septum formation initiator family protein [Gemmatimonadota bacterium]|jgi:cell division protein FtsB|nr:MAG: septum formation initiator family protein [Gemmatimonadota bacterium]
MSERLRRVGLRLLVAALVVAAGYYFILGGEYSALDLRALRAEEQVLTGRIDSLASVTDSLDRWADSLEWSAEAIERVARERYGFIRDGERLYRFVEVEAVRNDPVDR